MKRKNDGARSCVRGTPEWQMYCVLTEDENVQKRFEKADFWDKLI
jgi:hypothetical protein